MVIAKHLMLTGVRLGVSGSERGLADGGKPNLYRRGELCMLEVST